MNRFMNPAEFDNIAQSEKDFWWYRGMRAILFRVLEPYLRDRKIRRVLEAGCGTGYFSHLLQKERGLHVVPIDISSDGLRYARSLDVQSLTQGDVTRLPFAGASFDAVISLDVIVHLPRGVERLAADEFARVLKPGGLLVIRASALDWLRSRHSQFAFERQRFTRRRLVALVESAGVRVLRCTYLNSLLLPVALLKFRVWEPLTRKPPASGIQPVAPWLDRLLYAPLALEASCAARGMNFPIGQTLLLIGEKAARS